MTDLPPTATAGDILVVDDNPNNLTLLANILTEEGYRVRKVLNGKFALRTAQASPPDLILLDIYLPDLDGYEVCWRLKALEVTRETPVIFISALNEVWDKLRAFKVGAADYITKPFQVEEVLARVQHQLTIRAQQQTIREQNRQLKAALAAEKELSELKTQFVSMVSHEFRNPLTTIATGLKILEQRDFEFTAADRQQRFTIIRNAVRQMTYLLDDVLELCRAESGQLTLRPEWLDLGDFCQELLEELRNGAGHDHWICLTGDPPNEPLWVDSNILRHILANLLGNAVKYSPAGSKVTLDLGSDRSCVQFRIIDSGIGIPESERPYMFQPFHRALNVGKIPGTGLGLSIVKNLIELLGGQIDYTSQIDVGTTFIVTLPAEVVRSPQAAVKCS